LSRFAPKARKEIADRGPKKPSGEQVPKTRADDTETHFDCGISYYKPGHWEKAAGQEGRLRGRMSKFTLLRAGIVISCLKIYPIKETLTDFGKEFDKRYYFTALNRACPLHVITCGVRG